MSTIRFDDEGPWVLSRAWAREWVTNAPGYWLQVIEDYRNRVGSYYADEFADAPSFFPFMEPTTIRVVLSLARTWIFAKPVGEGDEVIVEEHWEDADLAQLEILQAPNHEARARTAAAIDEDYVLVDTIDMTQGAHVHPGPPGNPFAQWRIPDLGSMAGWSLADSHHSVRIISEAVAASQGRQLDRSALRQLQAQLVELDTESDMQARGLRFEGFIQDLLKAHGCTVEKGKHRPGEQVDIFIHRPFRALVECKWQQERIGVPAVALLIAKLQRNRPSIVSGICVSMNGFTAEAHIEAEQHTHERVVVLFDRVDIESLLTGQQHVADLFEGRVDAFVRRF